MIQPSNTFQELFYISHFSLHRYSKRTFHPNGMNMKAMQMEQLIANDDGPQTRLCTYPWLKVSCKLQQKVHHLTIELETYTELNSINRRKKRNVKLVTNPIQSYPHSLSLARMLVCVLTHTHTHTQRHKNAEVCEG
jgi:hypothetical protein